MYFEPFPKDKATGISACHIFVLLLETDLTRKTLRKKSILQLRVFYYLRVHLQHIASHFAFVPLTTTR